MAAYYTHFHGNFDCGESVPCGVNCRHSWCLVHKSLGDACLCTSCGSAFLPVVSEIGRAGQEECRCTLAQCRQ